MHVILGVHAQILNVTEWASQHQHVNAHQVWVPNFIMGGCGSHFHMCKFAKLAYQEMYHRMQLQVL